MQPCESPLAGGRPAAIPRLKRVLELATRASQPAAASPVHLLLVLVEGDEPACEHLAARGVDLHALASATRRILGTPASVRPQAR